jgi:hypothetical protein
MAVIGVPPKNACAGEVAGDPSVIVPYDAGWVFVEAG